jgi:hypothetical protein
VGYEGQDEEGKEMVKSDLTEIVREIYPGIQLENRERMTGGIKL